MIQFNPDGSLKVSSAKMQQKALDEERMKNARCISVIKELVRGTPPKQCVLRFTLSEKILDNRFMETTYKYFREHASVPTKFIKINEKEFRIEIGTDFKRCSDCCNLVNRYREFLDGNIIEKKSGCTFEGFRKSFSYEDYFD